MKQRNVKGVVQKQASVSNKNIWKLNNSSFLFFQKKYGASAIGKFGLNFSRGAKKLYPLQQLSTVNVVAIERFFYESLTVILLVPLKCVRYCKVSTIYRFDCISFTIRNKISVAIHLTIKRMAAKFLIKGIFKMKQYFEFPR